MKYSNTAVRELSAKYRSILKKCAYLNAIAIMGIAFGANADVGAIIYHTAGGQTDYESFDEAISSITDWTKGSGIVVQNDSSFTYDFGGKTYSAFQDPAGSENTRTQIFQLLKDSTITFKNGKINVAEETADGPSGNFLMGIQNYSDLTLDNMVVDGTNLLTASRSKGTVRPRYTLSNNNGDTTIKNSTIIAKEGGVAFDVFYNPNHSNFTPTGYGPVSITLQDSIIQGDVEVGIGETEAYAKDFDKSQAVLNTEGVNTIAGNLFNGGTVNIGGDLTLTRMIKNEGNINVTGNLTLVNEGINNLSSIIFEEGSSLKFDRGLNSIIWGNGYLGGRTKLVLENTASDNSKFIIQASVYGLVFEENPLYNLSTEDLGDNQTLYHFTKKSTSEVVANLAKEGVNAQQAATISAFADSKAGSPVLSAITEAVQSGNAKGAAKLAEEVAPTTSQTVMGVAQGVNSILNNVAGTRMAAVGRNGGDAFVGGAMWVQGLMNHTKQDSTSNAAGFTADTNGISFGIDGKVNENLMVGIGYGYTNTDADSGARDIDVDGHNFFAYTEYKKDNWYVNGMFNYGFSKYDEQKIAGLGAKYDVNTYAANIMTGYTYDNGLTPEVGLRYLLADQDSYNDGVQRISTDKTDVLTGVVGVKYKADVKAKDWTFTPNLRLAATYDMMSDNSKANVSVIGGGNYQITSDRLERFGIETGVGIGTIYKDWNFSVDYNGGFRKDFQSHTGMLKAKYNF